MTWPQQRETWENSQAVCLLQASLFTEAEFINQTLALASNSTLTSVSVQCGFISGLKLIFSLRHSIICNVGSTWARLKCVCVSCSWITAVPAAEQSAMVVIVLCGGLVVCGKGRRKRTSHSAAVSWERLSSLVVAVSLSITATASCFAALFGAKANSFCHPHFVSVPLFCSHFLRASNHLFCFHPSCVLLTLWAFSFSLRLHFTLPLTISCVGEPLWAPRHTDDSPCWHPRWHRASGAIVAGCMGAAPLNRTRAPVSPLTDRLLCLGRPTELIPRP